MFHSFGSDRSQEQLELAANQIIREIEGLKDRAELWLLAQGRDASPVKRFISEEFPVALIQDLGNTDKHFELTRKTFSGHRPRLGNVSQGLTASYDPSTGMYAQAGEFIGCSFDTWTGQIVSEATASNVELTLCADILDERGSKLAEIQRAFPDAIYRWEQFLASLGIAFA